MNCKVNRNRQDSVLTDIKFDSSLVSLGYDLDDETEVGVQFLQDLKRIKNTRISLGFKKVLSSASFFKAKIDSGFNAFAFAGFKFTNGVNFQFSAGTNFTQDFRRKGLLGNNFSLGVKLSYKG